MPSRRPRPRRGVAQGLPLTGRVRQLLPLVALVAMSAGCDPYPLHRLAADGDVTGVQRELDRGTPVDSPDDYGETALHRAVPGGGLKVVTVLLEHGASANAPRRDGLKPLHCAAAYQRPDLVRVLLRHGAELEGVDDRGRTPLHLAAFFNREEMIPVLLRPARNWRPATVEAVRPYTLRHGPAP